MAKISRTSFILDQETRKRLEAVSKEKGRTMTHIVKEAVRLYFFIMKIMNDSDSSEPIKIKVGEKEFDVIIL